MPSSITSRVTGVGVRSSAVPARSSPVPSVPVFSTSFRFHVPSWLTSSRTTVTFQVTVPDWRENGTSLRRTKWPGLTFRTWEWLRPRLSLTDVV